MIIRFQVPDDLCKLISPPHVTSQGVLRYENGRVYVRVDLVKDGAIYWKGLELCLPVEGAKPMNALQIGGTAVIAFDDGTLARVFLRLQAMPDLLEVTPAPRPHS
jgi:hypothetical protein